MSESRFSPDSLPEAQVSTIWDRGPHNAFPDITVFNGELYATCREGEDHMSYDGTAAVFRESKDKEWELETEFSHDGADLRDPKLSVTPDGQLLCLAIIRWEENNHEQPRSILWKRDRERNWNKGVLAGGPGISIWRLTWLDEWGYGVGYKTGNEHFVRLYRTRNGQEFEVVNNRIYAEDFPNEAVLGFNDTGKAYCLLRKNRGTQPTGLLGKSRPPYDDWQWCDLGLLLGGPNLTRIPGKDSWLAGGRVTIENSYTGLLKLNVVENRLEPLLQFPSEGDHGYPGFAWRDGILHVVYYSERKEQSVIQYSRLLGDQLLNPEG